MKIMILAVKRRVAEGEDINDVLASYSKLTNDEKTYIKKQLGYDINFN